MHVGDSTRSNWAIVRDSKAIRIWSFTVTALALLFLAAVRMDTLTWGAVGIMSALGIATSLFSFRVDERTSVTFGPAVFMGSIALFGALVAVWVAAISSLLLELVRFRKGGAPALARVGIQVIGVLAAAGVYWLVDGEVNPTGLSLVTSGKFVLMFASFTAITGLLNASLEDPGSGRLRRYVRWLSGRGVVVELAMLPLSLLLVASYIPGEPATFPLLAVVLIISSAAGQKIWETQLKLRDRVSELRLLNTIGDALSCVVRLDELVRLVHTHTQEQLAAPVTSVALYDEENRTLSYRTCVNENCDTTPHSVDLGAYCESSVAITGEPLYVEDVTVSRDRQLEPHVENAARAEGVEIRSWLGVPLVAEDKLIGVLSIMSGAARAFDDPTRELMETIGTQVGKVVATAQLYERLREAQEATQSWNRELEQKVEERTSELTEAREELETLNEDLERRVEERTQELKDMQDRIVESGRMAAIGELAAGVAHELNNPLGGILGYTQYDLEKLQDVDASNVTDEDIQRVRGHLSYIEQGAQRCTKIVESLVRFSQTSRSAETEVNVREVVEETLGFTSRELASRGIELKTDLSETDLLVNGDPGQLKQVFANIVLNARKAMPSGGRLSVSTWLVHGNGSAGDVVAISFGDTGCGISQEHLGRLFEPFYTTGEVGQGSGLGLSVSYGIVKDHGGSIDVESKVGVGSTFTVLLPTAGAKVVEAQVQGAA